MKKKLLALLFASAMLSVLVTGCTKPNTPPENSTSTGTVAPAAEPVTITFGYSGDSGETEDYTKATTPPST